MRNRLVTCVTLSLALIGFSTVAQAQLAPEIGYMLPSGAKAGSTVEVTLGGYDWTPDMQLFVHDPRIKIELLGSPSGVLVPEPPYWFGAKARGPAWPCPREFKARLTIPSDVPPGLVRWQVANANGASPAEWLHVSGLPEVAEDPKRKVPQVLPPLPVAISGQIRRIEEVDRYEFRVEKTGPVTIELLARQLNSPLHGMLQVQDSTGRKLVDVADSEGRDLVVTFVAQAQERYVLSLHDLDYAGDRSYVYRLLLAQGPQVQAAYPTAGKRGQTQRVFEYQLLPGQLQGGIDLAGQTGDLVAQLALFLVIPGLAARGDWWLFQASLFVVFTMYGGGFATIPAFLADIFGPQNVGAIHGAVLTAWSAAAIAGPLVITELSNQARAALPPGADRVGIYDAPLQVLAGLLAVGALLTLFVRPLRTDSPAR